MATQTHTYHFPLRPELTVSFQGVPRDLTRAEAERLIACLRAIAANTGH